MGDTIKLLKLLANGANGTRLRMIIFAHSRAKSEFRMNDIMSKECLGDEYDNANDYKSMQYHFYRIVACGIFVSVENKKAYYTYNSEPLAELNNMTNKLRTK